MKNSSVKAFLFDYDGVMTTGVKDSDVAKRLSINLGVPEESAAAWLRSVWQALLAGTLTIEESWTEIERQYGQPITTEQRDVWFVWGDEIRPLTEMIQLVRTLKAKGYPVGLLSNVTAHSADIIRRHGGYDEFDFLVLSCDVGNNKPEPKIYHLAIEALGGILPEAIVFLDDRESNIVTATSVGMKAIFVETHADAIQQVHELTS